VNCVAFKPDNPNILVSCSDDKTIKMWDITSGSCLSTSSTCDSRVNTVSFSKDGQHIAAGTVFHGVYIFSLNQQSQDFEIRSECPLSCGDEVNSVQFSQDGQHIVAGCDDGVYIFSLNQQSQDFAIRSECPLRGHRYVPSLSKEYFLS